MQQRIVYQNDNGGIDVIVPTPECLKVRTIEEIAFKDVPAGKPFKIVNLSDLPSDRVFRDAWEIDPSLLTDGVGSESNEFARKIEQ